MTSRELALRALEKWRRSGTFPDINTREAAGLDRRDAALAERILLGVLQNMALLDYNIDKFSSVKTVKMQPKVLDILRVSAYQILFLERVPPSAIVNEAVEICKIAGASKAGGLVNAVLRRISENREKAFDVHCVDITERLSVRFSHPLWLVNELISRLGTDGAEAYLAKDNEIAPVCSQINTLKTDVLEFGEAHPWLSDCRVLTTGGDPKKLVGFEAGEFYIQDPAARCAVLAVYPERGSVVLDACAAPGGKTFALAILMQNSGTIYACDINGKKLSKIVDGAARLGITCVQTRQMDAREPDSGFYGMFDTVFADVPCSGLGVIRKKPEIRYKTPDELAGLPEIQLSILRGLAPCVKPGGVMLYSTCTVLRRENEAVIVAFLDEASDFSLEGFTLPCPGGEAESGMITLWPHIHDTDGFFIAKMRKKA